MSEVINIYRAPQGWRENPKYIYIGREGRGCDGYFGNPFPLTTGEGRGATLARFEDWARKRIAEDPEYRERVKALHDKVLVCFCKPAACHGDILSTLARELVDAPAASGQELRPQAPANTHETDH